MTEASIVLPTGELLIAGCTDYWPDAKRIELAAGTWRIRASELARERVLACRRAKALA